MLLVAAVGATPVVSRAQQVEAMSTGLHQAASRTIDPDAPGVENVALVSGLLGSSGALTGGMLGFAIDNDHCRRHHLGIKGSIFDPCAFYTAAATPIGWFGGSVAGATVGATLMARERGCPTPLAILRSLGGAAVGALPGALIVARRPENYPPRRSIYVFGAPLLAAAGATLAVVSCHS